MSSDGDRFRTEDDLAREARAGSLPAFEALARRVQAPLVGFLERRFPSRRDAEDVAQEALVKAWLAIDSYKEGKRFRTWVFTIAYRVAVSWGRGQTRGDGAGDLDPAALSTAGEDPALAAETRERGERVWAAAREVLTDEQVSALWLYYVEELPAGEVARVMGRSWVSVKTMLHRARKKLAPHLAGEVEGNVIARAVGGVR